MNKINKLFFGIIGFWTFLGLIFGIFDLEISKHAVIYRNTLWSELGLEYGDSFDEPLFYLGITIIIGSIFNNINMQRRIGFMMILYSLGYVVYSVLIGLEEHIFRGIMMIIFLLTFLILTYNKDWRNFVPIAISLIFLILFLEVTVDIMKIIWGRQRFLYISSDKEFTEWYIIKGGGYNYEEQSFPSGHASAAWCFLPLLFLIRDKKINKKLKLLLGISVIGFGLFVAISRVIRGAHYASDVLFSTGIAIVLTILLYKLFYQLNFKINWNENLSNPIINIRYSQLTDQWMGIYHNARGQIIYTFFNNYDDAIKFSLRIKSSMEKLS